MSTPGCSLPCSPLPRVAYVSRYAFSRRTHNFSLCKSRVDFPRDRSRARYICRWPRGRAFRVKTANSTATSADFLLVASAASLTGSRCRGCRATRGIPRGTTPHNQFSSGRAGMRERSNVSQISLKHGAEFRPFRSPHGAAEVPFMYRSSMEQLGY